MVKQAYWLISAFQVRVLRSLKFITAKVESQSRILESMEAWLNQQQGATGISTNNTATELRKSLPLQTHCSLQEFEKLLETEENRVALLSVLGFSYSCISSAKALISPMMLEYSLTDCLVIEANILPSFGDMHFMGRSVRNINKAHKK